MKIIIKIIIKELVPNIILRGLRYLIHSKSNATLINEDISNLKDKYNLLLTRESVIIGNGPSLMHTLTNHLSFFNNKTIFCVNNFVASEYLEIIKPTFYVLADPAYWCKNCSPALLEHINNTYEQLKIKVKWQMFLLLPAAARGCNYFINLPIENENIILAYYNSNGSEESLEKAHVLYKNNKAMPPPQTVLISAIFLSLNLGFKTNYLVGADLSLHENIFVNKSNVVCFYDRHFYDNVEQIAVPFWKNDDIGDPFKMDETFLAFSRMFKGFWELEEYSKYLNAKIYNASHISYIDAFERYDLEK